MTMESFLSAIIFAFITFLVGVGLGGSVVGDGIAEKCKRQGSFYVGKDDFKCEVKQ